jgi:hypothetical protein
MSIRTEILFQSALSGAVMGLLAAVALFGLGLVIAFAAPSVVDRLAGRWLTIVLLALFAGLPAAGAVVGFLEGRLKLPG